MTAGRYIDHLTGPADRWDLLAWRYYGDANRTQPLVRANRHIFAPLTAIPMILPAGLTIKVPVLDPEPEAQDLLPPWKRGAA